MRSVAGGQLLRKAAGAVMDAFAIENLWDIFLNPGFPGFGLFGGGKMQQVAALSSGC